MSTDPLRLPPEEAWIERREEFIQGDEATHHGVTPGKQTRRIIGNLAGAWPNHGRVRYLPSSTGEKTITEASLAILPDGSIHPEIS